MFFFTGFWLQFECWVVKRGWLYFLFSAGTDVRRWHVRESYYQPFPARRVHVGLGITLSGCQSHCFLTLARQTPDKDCRIRYRVKYMYLMAVRPRLGTWSECPRLLLFEKKSQFERDVPFHPRLSLHTTSHRITTTGPAMQHLRHGR